MRLIDSHCHLADERFATGLDAVLSRARVAGVVRWIVPTAGADEWQRLEELAALHEGVLPAYGIHPWYCDRHRDLHLRQLKHRLRHAVALGECGLDFGPGRPAAAVQEHWLEQQLWLAESMDMPVILHAYKSLDRLIQMLKAHDGLCGVVHGFAGSLQQAERLVDMGYYLGLGTLLMRSKRIQRLAARLPEDCLLLESDAPDQSLRKGELNQPAVLPQLLATLAALRKACPDQLARRLNANAAQLFKLEE